MPRTLVLAGVAAYLISVTYEFGAAAWLSPSPMRVTTMDRFRAIRSDMTTTTTRQHRTDSRLSTVLGRRNEIRFILGSPLYQAKDQEEILRGEIAQRNSRVANEQKYAVPDTTSFVGEPRKASDDDLFPKSAKEMAEEDDTRGSPMAPESLVFLSETIQRITKPRSFPFFVLEKTAEVIETSLGLSSSSLRANTSRGAVKEKIVVLGSGWGAVSFLTEINTNLYDVTVISPRNHFVFTPMLAGASVGTVEYRSICEPIREINRKATYLEATAMAIDPVRQTVSCESVRCDGNSCDVEEFAVEYDKLVCTVGAQTNTFGVPGVREYCCFLRTVEDSRRIRYAIINCFERASLPNQTDEERERILTFAVVGAGPTGIEFAAELRDFVEEDGPKYYPDLLKHVRIKVIEATSTVLAPFEKSLQEEAIKQMNRKVEIKDPKIRALLPERFQLTELLLESSVRAVGENTIRLNDGRDIPYGLALWAAGNGPIPLTLQLVDALGGDQAQLQNSARGRIAIDPWMRVIGGQGKILAFGDCSYIAQSPLPATAQVAAQQGEYLAQILNRKFDLSPDMVNGLLPPPQRVPGRTETRFSDLIASFAMNNFVYAKPFQFLNLGILAYTGGGTALAQVKAAPNFPAIKGTGFLGNVAWRGVYWYKQVSWRNRLLVINDWSKRIFFGRDVTRI